MDVMAQPVGEPLTRRERVRAETVEEIKQTARRVLVEQGPDGLALRAVAREMGITAPALYRYFDSREELIEAVVADLYDELTGEVERAIETARPATVGVQLMEASRAFRRWATTHHLEFGLLFATPAESIAVEPHGIGEGPAQEAGRRFGAVFGALFAQLYMEHPFPIPPESDLEPDLQQQLREWCVKLLVDLPLGAMYVFLSCWIRLYGIVCMEIFGHLRFALDDAEPMFEAELRSLGQQLGIAEEYRPPSAA
jgi:AcrR family transcriptional regulator